MLADVVWHFLTQCYLPRNLLGGTDTINPDTRGGGRTHPLSGWRVQESRASLKSWQVEGRSPRKEPQEARDAGSGGVLVASRGSKGSCGRSGGKLPGVGEGQELGSPGTRGSNEGQAQVPQDGGMGSSGNHSRRGRGGRRWKAPEKLLCCGRFIKIVCHRNCVRLTPSALLPLTAPQAPSPLLPICTHGSVAPSPLRTETSACSKARSSHLT